MHWDTSFSKYLWPYSDQKMYIRINLYAFFLCVNKLCSVRQSSIWQEATVIFVALVFNVAVSEGWMVWSNTYLSFNQNKKNATCSVKGIISRGSYCKSCRLFRAQSLLASEIVCVSWLLRCWDIAVPWLSSPNWYCRALSELTYVLIVCVHLLKNQIIPWRLSVFLISYWGSILRNST